MTTTSPPAAIIDTLNGLLEAELNSIFRFMGEGYPFLNRATVEVRKPLREMVLSNERRAAEIAERIFTLGGEPLPKSVEPEEQYLAFLSLKFLLPKLVNAKKLMIQRYENALNVVSPNDGTTTALVQRLLDEHRSELQSLEHAATQVK
jgi:bacterioferritin (cytochrome b1)